MSWFELFDIVNEIYRTSYGDSSSKFEDYLLSIKKYNNMTHISVLEEINNITFTIIIITVYDNEIIYHDCNVRYRIQDYKQYTDETEITLSIGRVPDYSIIKHILGKNDELE